jgi:AcrR family transcriptional regulator
MARPRSDIMERIVHAARERFLQDERIVHAARERFLQDGVDGASLRGIARDAKTNIGMIYYYFPTKDDLFLAVVEEVYAGLLAGFEQALAPDVPFAERIRRLYVRIGRIDEAEFKVMRLVVREALISSTRLDRVIERFLRGHIPLILRAVADGVAEGALRRDVHPALFMMAVLVIGGPPQLAGKLARERLGISDLPTAEALASTLVELLLHGIAARSSTEAPGIRQHTAKD